MIRPGPGKSAMPVGDYLSDLIIESFGDGVLIVDSSGLIHRHNERFLDLWGLDSLPADCTDSLVLAHLVKDKLKSPEIFMERIGAFVALEDRQEQVDFLEFRDGRVLERRLRFLLDGERQHGRLLVFRDVTDQRKAEENALALAHQVQGTQRLESLGVLAGGLAHEFKNMLMAIMGNADLLQWDMKHSPESQDHLKEIRSASLRAADLCDQMQTYAGKGDFHQEAIDLETVVREMDGILGVSMGKNVILGREFQQDLPRINGDLAQMRQMILNLISNAADACRDQQDSRVELKLYSRHCDEGFLEQGLSGNHSGPGLYVCLEVGDTGCGMTAREQTRVFDPFYTTKFLGRGLGLSAVLGIVRGHGGMVTLQSRSGRGSTFTVLLPTASRRGQVREIAKAAEWPQASPRS